MVFYLGTHQPIWLRLVDVPLFVSDVRLRTYKTPPRARGIWALDSGGFSELSLHGKWTVPPAEYVARVRRYRDEVGGLQWATIQDWMCEPHMLVKTGLSLEEHQRRTVESFLRLRDMAPDLPWAPVLQGWGMDDYLRCVDKYTAAGVDLLAEPIVGVGSVCRRQHTDEATRIMRRLSSMGLLLHGFGFKVQGLLSSLLYLASADSLAWSLSARKNPILPGHDMPGPRRRKGHSSCANCMDYALMWRDKLMLNIEHRSNMQMDLCFE
jgi:hypothetical protein